MRKNSSPSGSGARGSIAPNGDKSFSFLAADVHIKGTIEANAALHIGGRVDGDIVCDVLFIEASGVVEGTLRAKTSVEIHGQVKGTIESAHVIIHSTAQVAGDVIYGTLRVEEGAHMESHLQRQNQADGKLNDPHATAPPKNTEETNIAAAPSQHKTV